ncbi:MAG: hypothetical protein C5B59_13160 [Bacteroidetes bacterium]|nr:MAG: hypothetical protein C5B59_13160 [Bacteroidota bacterium]
MESVKSKKWWDGLVIFSLVAGIICFGFVFADSFSDHDKILHFSAHFGMSFMILSFTYAFCYLKWRMGKWSSYSVSILITLLIGSIYKIIEIWGMGLLHNYGLGRSLVISGCLTSLSQNIAGILAGMLIIQYFFSNRVVLLQSKLNHEVENEY